MMVRGRFTELHEMARGYEKLMAKVQSMASKNPEEDDKHEGYDEETNRMLNAYMPEGMFRTPDPRIQMAAMEAERTNQMTPVLKEELRLRILARRMERGEPDLDTRHVPKTYELTDEEKEKRERRKEQNRRAAKKCRQKRKMKNQDIAVEYESNRKTKETLEDEILTLQKQKAVMELWMKKHVGSPQCKFSSPKSTATSIKAIDATTCQKPLTQLYVATNPPPLLSTSPLTPISPSKPNFSGTPPQQQRSPISLISSPPASSSGSLSSSFSSTSSPLNLVFPSLSTQNPDLLASSPHTASNRQPVDTSLNGYLQQDSDNHLLSSQIQGFHNQNLPLDCFPQTQDCPTIPSPSPYPPKLSSTGISWSTPIIYPVNSPAANTNTNTNTANNTTHVNIPHSPCQGIQNLSPSLTPPPSVSSEVYSGPESPPILSSSHLITSDISEQDVNDFIADPFILNRLASTPGFAQQFSPEDYFQGQHSNEHLTIADEDKMFDDDDDDDNDEAGAVERHLKHFLAKLQ